MAESPLTGGDKLISPDIKDLMRNMDSRYTLVVTAAKRARQLTGGAEPLTRFRSDKPVTLAIHEIAEGKVDYFRDALRLPDTALSHSRDKNAVKGPNIAGGYIAGIFDDEDGYADDAAEPKAYGVSRTIAETDGYAALRDMDSSAADGAYDEEDAEGAYGTDDVYGAGETEADDMDGAAYDEP